MFSFIVSTIFYVKLFIQRTVDKRGLRRHEMDTCMSHAEEDTCTSYDAFHMRRIHASHMKGRMHACHTRRRMPAAGAAAAEVLS